MLSLVPGGVDVDAAINGLRAMLIQALAKADWLDLSMTGIQLDSAIAANDAALAPLSGANC